MTSAYDICLESLRPDYMHIIIELKQGDNVDQLKEEALQQIMKQKYYAGLKGKVMCIGLAHNKKKCAVVHKILAIT